MNKISPEERFYLALMSCGERIRRVTEQLIAQHGLTVAQYHLLRIIQNSPSITAGETRKRLMASAPSIAQLIAQLEERGWIRRVADTKDARKLCLLLTVKGKQVTELAHRSIERMLKQLRVSSAVLHSLTSDLSSLHTTLSTFSPYGKQF